MNKQTIKVISVSCTSQLPLSKVIRWFQKYMPWNRLPRTEEIPSHSAQVLLFTEMGCAHVYESTWYGYRPTAWSRWLKTHELISAHAHANSQHTQGIQWAFRQAGVPYEYKSLFIFAWKITKYILGFKWVRYPNTTATSMHCSEASTRFLQQDGIWTDINPDAVSPLEFMHRLNADPDFTDVTSAVLSGQWFSKYTKP